MQKAIHYGAGNIGRGFIGGLLAIAGYHVVFADINDTIINKLNCDNSYKIIVVDEKIEEQLIENVSGLNVQDDKLIDVAEEADIITTAVGPVALPKIAGCIAKGISRRYAKGIKRTLNVIACENMFGASDSLKQSVLGYLNEEEKRYCEEFAGFPNSVVDRIVPPSQGQNTGSLEVEVEPFYEWIVERKGFKGEIPKIYGMILTEKLVAYVERKLLTLNTGHAVTAYLGKILGLGTIKNSISNEMVFKIVYGAMVESGEVLIKKHGFDTDVHMAYINKIINRFKNPYLDDSVERVGREPLRKLSKDDRLIKPLLLAEEYGVDPKNLIIGAAAALHFKSDSDKQSIELHEMISEKGVEDVLIKVSGIGKDSKLIERIVEAYNTAEDKSKLMEIYAAK